MFWLGNNLNEVAADCKNTDQESNLCKCLSANSYLGYELNWNKIEVVVCMSRQHEGLCHF